MTEAQTALSRRLVACKGWRWMPGMRAVGKHPSYPVRIHDFGENVQDTDDMLAADKWLPWQQPTEYGDSIYPGPYLPDLTDPATVGCLLALVREAWRCVVVTSPEYDYNDEEARQGAHVIGWRAVETVRWMPVGEGATEAEALVAALEGAP